VAIVEVGLATLTLLDVELTPKVAVATCKTVMVLVMVEVIVMVVVALSASAMNGSSSAAVSVGRCILDADQNRMNPGCMNCVSKEKSNTKIKASRTQSPVVPHNRCDGQAL
jgi:hypothetical protein